MSKSEQLEVMFLYLGLHTNIPPFNILPGSVLLCTEISQVTEGHCLEISAGNIHLVPVGTSDFGPSSDSDQAKSIKKKKIPHLSFLASN